jgi:hypothetical protein
MRIYKSSHLRKITSIYAHFGLCICVFTETKMHIYKIFLPICAFCLPYIHILASIYACFGFCICAFMETKKRIYEISLLYMHIFPSVYVQFYFRKCTFFPSVNENIRKFSSVYAHFVFCICTELLEMCILAYVYVHL